MKEINKVTLPVAQDFLAAAQGHLGDRASTYDKPAGERSMERTIKVFAALTDIQLTEEQRKAKGVYIATEIKVQETKKHDKLKRQGRNPDLVEKQAKDTRNHLLKTIQKRNLE